jgi:hypothetical protein
LVEDPIEYKCTQYMPKKIKGNMFWSIVSIGYPIEPENDQKETKKERFKISKKGN